MGLRNAVLRLAANAGYEIRRHPDLKPPFPESTSAETALVEKFRDYTRTGRQRQWTLLKALEYVDANAIEGDIVECGVWRGGNMLMLKDAAAKLKRKFWLYDTFEGMPPATDHDVDIYGSTGEQKREADPKWCYASLEEVQSNFSKFGLMDSDLIFRQGFVESTLREDPLPEKIAVLRLDTDFYESTKMELEVLYPKLVVGGVLIIDDYGQWKGSKLATDEYFAGKAPFFVPVDHTARYAVKVKQ
jgi:O-methyltransferase